jgi:hypothetical protein
MTDASAGAGTVPEEPHQQDAEVQHLLTSCCHFECAISELRWKLITIKAAGHADAVEV